MKSPFLEDENLRKLARQIMVSRNANAILLALPALIPEAPKPNIQKLTDYINQQDNPEQFMNTLFAFCGGDIQ